MTYRLIFSFEALKDLKKHKRAGDKKILQKIELLLNELKLHPKRGTGQPEKLKHNLEGFYSRRISKKHRLIYTVQEEIVTVMVVSAYSHYRDK